MLALRKFVLILSIFGQFLAVEAFAETKSAKPISRTYGFAGTLVDFGICYSQSKATATPSVGNTWDNSTSIYDVKLGYINDSSIYLGAIYTARADNQASANQTSGSSTGLGLGLFSYSGFNFRAYYKFGDTFGDYKDGAGYQFDMGYAINPTSSFYLGLNISFRESTYKTNATIAGFDSWSRKETYPFVTLGFLIF